MSETREREKGDAGRFEEDGPASWPANIREFVEDEQERAYWDVAMELGLGPNPTAAYQRVIRPLMPLSQIQATKSAELGKSIVDIYGKYFGHELPTKFEDPNYYPIMLLLLDQVLAAFSTIGRQVPARPFVATMPSGRVNATTRADDATGRSVI